MKKVLTFLACFGFLVPFAISSVEEGYYSYSYARLSYVKGDVFIQRAEDLGYEEGVVNIPVVEGDKLGTREGRAEIHFGKRNYLRIDSFTQIDFVNLPRKGYDQIKLHLLSGSIFLRINYLESEKDFEIHSPDGSFYILEEGLYRFDVRENRETELLVYEGTMESAGEEGSLLVRSEEKLIVSNGIFRSDPVNFYASYDDSFSRWNRSRDSLLARSNTRKYLPSELYEYEVELSNNGRWIYEQPYGYVWTPYVHYYHDWRPYYYGRWSWYPIIGWTWIPYEPWGWSVYHYGRWHWRLGLGWYWIPTRYWGPAWVHWHCGYDYIGWCPLSYYGYPGVVVNNRYYGRYYGRYYPVHSRALTVIHKNQLHARRISQVALSRDKVTRLSKISLSARQPSTRGIASRASPSNSEAKKVLSRSNIRKVSRSYNSGKAGFSSSRLKSTGIKTVSRDSSSRTSLSKARSPSKKIGKVTNSRLSSQTPKRYNSKSSLSKARISNRTSSGFSSSIRPKSTVRTYPSRHSSSISRSRSISSSPSSGRSFSSTRRKSDSNLASSSRAVSSKSAIRTYPRSRENSRSLSSSAPSSGKKGKYYSSSSSRSNVSRSQSPVKRYTSRSSYSSSRYSSSRSQAPNRSIIKSDGYKSSFSRRESARLGRSSRVGSMSSRSYKSRSYSAPRRSYSNIKSSSRSISRPTRTHSSKSYSSPSRSSRSSYSRASRSPSRSSSSRSVSRSRVKKR